MDLFYASPKNPNLLDSSCDLTYGLEDFWDVSFLSNKTDSTIFFWTLLESESRGFLLAGYGPDAWSLNKPPFVLERPLLFWSEDLSLTVLNYKFKLSV